MAAKSALATIAPSANRPTMGVIGNFSPSKKPAIDQIIDISFGLSWRDDKDHIIVAKHI